MKKLLVFFTVLLLSTAQYSFSENITHGTGALTADTTGDENSAIGSYSLTSNTTGHGNTALGAYAGRSTLTVNGGVYLGYGAGIGNTSAHKLYVNTMFYPAYGIFGDFSTGYFGINNTSPAVALDVTGAITASGALTVSSIASSGAITATSIATPTSGGVFSIPDSVNITGVLTVPTIKTAATGTQLSLDDSVDVSGAVTITGTTNLKAAVTATPSLTVRANVGGAGADSSVAFTFTTGNPVVTFNASDGDQYTQSINTSDEAVFAGADVYRYTGNGVYSGTVQSTGLTTYGSALSDSVQNWWSANKTLVARFDSLGNLVLYTSAGKSTSLKLLSGGGLQIKPKVGNTDTVMTWNNTLGTTVASIDSLGNLRAGTIVGTGAGGYTFVATGAYLYDDGANATLAGFGTGGSVRPLIIQGTSISLQSQSAAGSYAEVMKINAATGKVAIKSRVGDGDSLQVWQRSGGATVASVDSNGVMYTAGGVYSTTGQGLVGTKITPQEVYISTGHMLTFDGALMSLWGFVTPATTEQDLSPHNHDLTYNNFTAADQSYQGRVYRMLFYAGGNEYLNTADHADYTFNDGASGGFTMFFGVEVVAGTLEQTLVSKWDETTGAEDREWKVALDASEKVVVSLYDESANVVATRTSDAAVSAGFHLITVVYDGGGGATAATGIVIYVDGAAVASTAANDANYVTMDNGATQVYVGAYEGTGGTNTAFFKSYMSLVGITPTEYTADQVWQHYAAYRGFIYE